MKVAIRSCRFLGFLAYASALAAAPFLVPDRPYHCSSDQIRQTTFTLNFAEFRDSGAPWCCEQLTHALDQIGFAFPLT